MTVDEAKVYLLFPRPHGNEQEQQIVELLSALEADRERLDWLQKQDPVDDIGYGEDGHLWQIGEFHCDDIREAIDAAREGSDE